MLAGTLRFGVLALMLIAFTGAVSVQALDRVPDRRITRSKQPVSVPARPESRDTLVDLLMQLEALQTELRQLRNQVEVQSNEIERLKSRLRDLVRDLDRRVNALERNSAAARAAPVTGGGIPRVPPAVSTPRPALPVPAAAAPETGASKGEQREYDEAFNLLKQGYYDRAARAFRDFISRYPRSKLAGNAQYWIGEAHYVMRNFKLALEEFSKVERAYPASSKVPDAALKIGYSYYELGDWKKARTSLTDVAARFPNTIVAKSAEGYLAKLQKQGH